MFVRMIQWSLLIMLVAAGISLNHGAPELPSFLKVCRRKDPHLSECIKRSIDSLRPYLRVGIPEFQIPPCEPLTIASMNLSQATQGSVMAMKTSFSNTTIQGSTKFILRNVNADIASNQLELTLLFHRLSVTTDYQIRGHVLLLPINGHGHAQGNFSDVKVSLIVHGKQYQDVETKKKHFHAAKIDVDLTTVRANVYLDNHVNGDSILSDTMNNFLNENWQAIAEEMKPVVENSISTLLKEFLNNIVHKYPFDILLPI